MRPQVCLLDAGPVIELHRLGLWEGVVRRTELVIPSVVASREAKFWDAGEGVGKPIVLDQFINNGEIRIVDASPLMLNETRRLFDASLVDSIDLGELEALALLQSWQGRDLPSFCTGDRLATVGLCLLGHSDLAVSLEAFLERVGLGGKSRPQFRRAKMDSWVEEGSRRFITREGLRR